jgi:hypothetical protein
MLKYIQMAALCRVGYGNSDSLSPLLLLSICRVLFDPSLEYIDIIIIKLYTVLGLAKFLRTIP